ncbi:hypothetical protein Anapl_04655 [Anas platyrhynchos]|uniref:Uncharacterized protein n=1 Tax=Anas platyrhynchos TaxID=8839 RepID=R0LUE9_ANAPL|nr:hypothetical protein Anapl_04655 [Anas platyrhynchos]
MPLASSAFPCARPSHLLEQAPAQPSWGTSCYEVGLSGAARELATKTKTTHQHNIMDSSWKGYMLHLKVLKPITGAVNMVPLHHGPHRPDTHTSRGHDSSTKPGPAIA